MEKRTVEGKRRHDLSKKIWYKKKQKEKIRKELVNGRVLGYSGIRISDYWRIKIETGKTQILIIDGEIIPFRKKSNGYCIFTQRKIKITFRLNRRTNGRV